MKAKKMDLVGLIMEYEDGTLEADKTLELFAELIKSGQAWILQGSYGRMAESLIQQGYISKSGKILKAL